MYEAKRAGRGRVRVFRHRRRLARPGDAVVNNETQRGLRACAKVESACGSEDELVFLGSRDEVAHLGYVQGQCPKCGKPGIFTVYQNNRKLTVSVVAAFSVGQQYVLECRNCGVKFAIPPAMQGELQERLISADRMADFIGRMPALKPRQSAPRSRRPSIRSASRSLRRSGCDRGRVQTSGAEASPRPFEGPRIARANAGNPCRAGCFDRPRQTANLRREHRHRRQGQADQTGRRSPPGRRLERI